MPDVIRVANQLYNWNSSLSRFDGQRWAGVVEVNYGEKLEVETVYSQTRDGKPIGSTGGQYSADGFSIKMLRDSADALTTYLSLKPPFVGAFGRTEFHFQLSVTEPLLLGGIPIMLDAPVCRIVEHKAATAKGVEALVTEFTLWVKGFTINGKSLYARGFGV